MPHKSVDESKFVGREFHRLTVRSYYGLSRHKKRLWVCDCRCGGSAIVQWGALRSGNTKSCGCYQSEQTTKNNTTHGKSKTPTYSSWSAMIKRVTDDSVLGWKNYGGRGITVSEEWRDFSNFIKDMGEKPSSKHSIERIDNNKGYCKENCRWDVVESQANNKRSNKILILDGVSRTIAQWSRIVGLSERAIQKRLVRGWSHRDCLTKPIRVTSLTPSKLVYPYVDHL